MDAWCQNCQRLVAPMRHLSWWPMIAGWVVLFALAPRVGQNYSDTQVWGAVIVALCAWWWLRSKLATYSCPICRTRNLAAPTARAGDPRPR